jgi:hypothetical protein
MDDLMGVWVSQQAIPCMPHMRAVSLGRVNPENRFACQERLHFVPGGLAHSGLPVKHSMTVRSLREALIVVRTVVAFQQPIVIAVFSVNLM